MFFETGSTKGIPAQHAKRIDGILVNLDNAQVIDDMAMPGYDLHQLHGNRTGTWSVKVSGNWRISFQFINGNAYVVNLEDYH